MNKENIIMDGIEVQNKTETVVAEVAETVTPTETTAENVEKQEETKSKPKKKNRLLQIKPHVRSKELKDRSVFIYGPPKCGKTTFATSFPKAMLWPFEKGYAEIPHAMPAPADSWKDVIQNLKDLEDPEIKEAFEVIIWDVSDIAWQFCCDYIAKKHSTDDTTYESVADMGYGKGYALAGAEFDRAIRRILQLGYGLVMISHSAEKTVKDPDTGETFTRYEPTLDKRAQLVATRACDICAYAHSIVKTGVGKVSRLYLRESDVYVAGARLKGLPQYTELSFEALKEAVAAAVESPEDGSQNQAFSESRYRGENFIILLEDFQEVVRKLMTKDSDKFKPMIQEVVSLTLGDGKKVMECKVEDDGKVQEIVKKLNELADQE